MFQTKVTDKVKRDILYSITFCEVGAIYVIMWKNIVEPDRPQVTIYYGVCALHAGYLRLQTCSEYVMLIAFPPQQWLHECASMLCCMNIAVLL